MKLVMVVLAVVALLLVTALYRLEGVDNRLATVENTRVISHTGFTEDIASWTVKLAELQETQQAIQDKLAAVLESQESTVSSEWALAILYMDTLAKFYAETLLITIDPGEYEAGVQRVTKMLAFDPFLLSMWERVLTRGVEFSLFDMVLRERAFRALASALNQPFVSPLLDPPSTDFKNLGKAEQLPGI